MAAAYAALVSLIHVINRVQLPTCPASFDKLQMQTLLDEVGFLVVFLEACYQRATEDLERKIIEAAFAAEDMIETYIMIKIDEILTGERDQYYAFFCREELENITQEMDFIVQEAMAIIEKHIGGTAQLPRSSMLVGSSTSSSRRNKMVGFDEELICLMGQLTTDQSSREIISIVGMGGIGKTTFASSVYNHPFVVSHFHIRAWVTISHDYSLEEVILRLLRDIHDVQNVDLTENDTEKLGEQLYKCLIGRKYIIVLDDIWASLLWEDIRKFIPDNNNGSRILLSTRLLNVALNVGSSSPYEMKFLDDEKSWDLLCQTVFGREVCPSELENCGKEIARRCKGLPLAIVVIGGLLKMSDNTREYWESVEKDIFSVISREDNERCLEILSLSYHQLPIHLKPCFLHMATFPEDYEIHVSRLILLWTADGFLKPSTDRNLEEVALEYLNNLISRNLVLVKERNSSGKPKFVAIHDMLRSLCLKEAQKERFLYIVNEQDLDNQKPIQSHRRFVVLGSDSKFHPDAKAVRLTRSLVSFSNWILSPYPRHSLVRVLIIPRQYRLASIHMHHNLRLLTFSMKRQDLTLFFSSISLLWNLETLVVDQIPTGYALPIEIWKLQYIRHLYVNQEVLLPDPPSGQADIVLNNLQTLKSMKNLCFSDEMLKGMTNIKKLGTTYDFSKDKMLSPCFSNVVHFQKLETLNCSFLFNTYEDILSHGCISKHISDELKSLKLSPNLRKLTLSNSHMPWETMTIIGSLPNLEVLKLVIDAFVGKEWKLIEGEFQSLKYISIRDCHLVTWTAEDCSIFPRLESLNLSRMRHLEGIPEVFGELTMLDSIKLFDCSSSVVRSAKQILEEQQSQGNDYLRVEVTHRVQANDVLTELERWADSNFHIDFIDYRPYK